MKKKIKTLVTDRNTRNGKEEGRERTLFMILDSQMRDLTTKGIKIKCQNSQDLNIRKREKQ